MSESDCIFCDIIAGQAPASFVYQDDLVVAFMDIQPVNPGHLLVIPRAHATYLAEMDKATDQRLFQVGKELAAAVRRCGVRCEGVNLFLADGEAAGQEVFHVHLHVIPRFADDGFGFVFGRNYFQLPKRATLDDVATGIRQILEE